jgi:RAD51-like protein 2
VSSSTAIIADLKDLAVSDILRGIHLVRIPTQVQMIAFLHTIDDWVDEHPKVSFSSTLQHAPSDKQVKLVIIDTLSYHFRQPNMDMNARRRIMDM